MRGNVFARELFQDWTNLESMDRDPSSRGVNGIALHFHLGRLSEVTASSHENLSVNEGGFGELAVST